MSKMEYISVTQLCEHFSIETSFFSNLYEAGLIEIVQIEKTDCIYIEALTDLEKMIRIHRELAVNIEGIDVIFNLLNRVQSLSDELIEVRNKLSRYEGR